MHSWRPLLSQGRMVSADEQACCRGCNDKTQSEEIKLPEGSHRIKPSRAKARYSWQHQHGRPNLLSWQRCGAGLDGGLRTYRGLFSLACSISRESWQEDEDLKLGVQEPIVVIDEVD